MRSRWMQTRPQKGSTKDAKILAKVSVSDADTQADYQTKLDNFGLPQGMNLSAVIRATRQRGAKIAKLV